MESNDLLRLRAYLDQEEAAIARIWRETDADAKREFCQWACSSNPAAGDPPAEWIDFAARIAVWSIQSSVLRSQ